MGFSNTLALLIGLFLVLFVVAMVGVDEVFEFANLGLKMVEALLGLVEAGTCSLREECKLGSSRRGWEMKTIPFILSRSSGKRSGCLSLSMADMLDLSPLGVGVAMLVVVGFCGC